MSVKNFIETSNARSKQLMKLGKYIQDIEDQLLDGHPHIFPSLRIFFEAWCDYIIDKSIGLRIKETPKGKTRKEIHIYYDQLVSDHCIVSTLKGHELEVKYHEFSFAMKVRTIIECFSEIGIDTKKWEMNDYKDYLNKSTHRIIDIRSEDGIEEVVKQFRYRFEVLRRIHDGIYNDFLSYTFDYRTKLYVMPKNSEIIELASRYYSRHNN